MTSESSSSLSMLSARYKYSSDNTRSHSLLQDNTVRTLFTDIEFCSILQLSFIGGNSALSHRTSTQAMVVCCLLLYAFAVGPFRRGSLRLAVSHKLLSVIKLLLILSCLNTVRKPGARTIRAVAEVLRTDINYRECLSKYLCRGGGRWSAPVLVSW